MIERCEDGALRITLPSQCTIAEVEAHADKLRAQLAGAARAELHAQALEEIDTAYLQLLLSLRATLDEMDVRLPLAGSSSVLDEALKLFGVTHTGSTHDSMNGG